MDRIRVNLQERSYFIFIGSGVLKDLGKLIKGYNLNPKAVIISYKPVESKFLNIAKKSLKNEGFFVRSIELPIGEIAKNLKTVEQIYHKLVNFNMDRNSPLLALGGGVIGDLTGFVASTYLRGVPYIQIPTTLLAQVDSSIGGKTGVNLPEGKNLVGTFYQPKMVLIDTDFINTLNYRDFISGIAEIIKYGVIKDKSFFDYLQKNYIKLLKRDLKTLRKVIKKSCLIKSEIVEKDEKEKGIRSILNFGHTLGHAIESLAGYTRYTHGEAISMGMVAAALISMRLGLCSESTFEKIKNLINQIGLPSTLPEGFSNRDYLKAVMRDKKIRGEKIKFVALEKIGKVHLLEIKPQELITYL